MATIPIILAVGYTSWAHTPRLWRGCSEELSMIATALWLMTPPYLSCLVHLLGKSPQRLKKGLAWAVVAGGFWGGAALILVIAWVSEANWSDAGIAMLFTMSQIALVTCAMRTYYSGSREAGDFAVLAKRGLLFVPCLVFFAMSFFALPDLYATKRQGLAASAADALRKINSAEASYARVYSLGFSTTLAALGPPTGGAAPNASAAALMGRELASGAQFEYTFRYTPGARDGTGKVTTYTLTAMPREPQCTLWKRFFTDQTGKIHVTEENRAATGDDPAY